jgi:HSP20 family protein
MDRDFLMDRGAPIQSVAEIKSTFFNLKGDANMNTNLTNNRLREFLPTRWSDVDSLVNQLLGPQVIRSLNGLPNAENTWSQMGRVWEEEETFHIEMDIPGVAREDVELTYNQGELQISAERKAPEHESSPVDGHRYGNVVHTVGLPDTIDPSTIGASLEQGVLHVTVAKRPEAQPQRIEVK